MLMQTRSFFNKSLGTNILRGLELGEFSVFYQPKMDMKTRKIKGWKHLQDGIHPVLAGFPLQSSFP